MLTVVLLILGAVVAVVVVPLVHLLGGAAILTAPLYPAIIAGVVALIGGALALHFHALAAG